jgi:hypothetical protein
VVEEGSVTEGIFDDAIRQQLATFFEANTDAQWAVEDGHRKIKRPWGDPTFEIQIPDENPTELIGALNSVYLPPRFTALWHVDLKDLEFIWTAFPTDMHLRNRAFKFHFGDREYSCDWADASDRLLTIARASNPIEPQSSTDYRNLMTFILRLSENVVVEVDGDVGEPMSFWIRSFEWDENELTMLAQHINFYMRFYDRQSPMIVLHEALSGEKLAAPERYPEGDFPAIVVGRRLDPYLLAWWSGMCSSVSPLLRFLHAYQILEYAAFYYLKDDIEQAVMRIITSPGVLAKPHEVATQLLDTMVEDKMSDVDKLDAIVKEIVPPEALWKEIEPNIECFCHDVQFDGGTILPAFLKADNAREEFLSAGFQKFPGWIRKLRNGIVHAREQRGSGGILPTRANSEKIQPWLAPLCVAAEQIILFRGIM